ncbi:ribonucleoside-diphosphate reductase, adenosylcobalamin-dependent [Candidatus Woesearchaeota archaeon]|nr:ribonucleoside-diphosphate reductase, adenosylcobalamin-dependent [Candidatus Woesearchaeota archaeon]|tara:strand:- start:1160 stop:4090 length:2931 start_codon:yes stop_codon:yes gene_type:complete
MKHKILGSRGREATTGCIDSKVKKIVGKQKNEVRKIIKRDGSIVDFYHEKITNAIFKAAAFVGGDDRKTAEKLSKKVVDIIDKRFTEKIPSVEDVQNVVEEVLIKDGHAKTAKAFILHRAKRAELRAAAAESAKSKDDEKTALLHMFAHKSKLASLIGYDRLEAYKKLLFHIKTLQKSGKLPVNKNYLNSNELALNIYEKKYYLKDLNNDRIEKKPEDVFARLASFIAAVETDEEKQREWAEKYYLSLYNGQFLPGGRVIAGGGDLYRLKTMANCFVSRIDEDNIESIYKSAYECARTYSYGGGIGVDISVLRPKDSIVHNAADASTGSVSFMEIFSLTTGLIGQSGRRGALMLTIDIKHPDSPLFINVKNIPNWVTNQIVEQCKWTGDFTEDQLKVIQQQVRENTQVRFANISIKVSDEFMQAVEEQNNHQGKILVYRKDREVSGLGIAQAGSIHYSYGIPSKPIERYQLLEKFDNIDKLNSFLEKNDAGKITEEELSDANSRDMFGDLIVKSQVSEYDFAIKKAGDFMLYFNSPQTAEIKRLVKAREIWNSFVEGNYKTAEPGLIFWSTMTKYSPSNYVGMPILSTNPCGEVPLEDGGACNLASLNLSRFVVDGYTKEAKIDWIALREATTSVIRFLDNVVIWNELLNPLEKQRKAAMESRRLGLGVMGIADMLNQLGLGYDSDKGIEILEEVGRVIANTAYMASAGIAEEKGPSTIFDYEAYSKGAFFMEALDADTRSTIRSKGLRNIAILSIAPTGTISSIVLGYNIGEKNFIGVSGGIEPIFALYYTRRSESFGNKLFRIFHSTVNAYLQQTGLAEKAQKCKTTEELEAVLPKHFFRTAHVIDHEKRVKIQGLWQKYIDHSISSTINLPEDVQPEVISNVYLDAWKNGVKGVTIYRAGSRYPILSSETEKTEFQRYKDKTFETTIDDKKVQVKGGDVITLPDGKLTTVYHAMKEKKIVVKRELEKTIEKQR